MKYKITLGGWPRTQIGFLYLIHSSLVYLLPHYRTFLYCLTATGIIFKNIGSLYASVSSSFQKHKIYKKPRYVMYLNNLLMEGFNIHQCIFLGIFYNLTQRVNFSTYLPGRIYHDIKNSYFWSESLGCSSKQNIHASGKIFLIVEGSTIFSFHFIPQGRLSC